jgi:hypothetical protein
MSTKLISLGGGSVEVNNFYNEIVNESTGFEDPTDSSLSFDNGTRTFTIQPTGDSFVFWAFGTRYEKTSAENVQIDDVNGLWYISYNSSGVLGASQTIWDLSTQVPVATVLWNGATGDVGDEKNKGKTDKFLPIYVMGVSSPGLFTDDQLIFMHLVSGSESVELRKNLPYSFIKCKIAPTGSISFDIQVNQVSKGSADISASATTGSFTWNSKVTLDAGDWVEIYAPDTADASLKDVVITIVGIRV